MTTYAELQAKVSRTIQDPDNNTFLVQTIKDVIASSWQEVSRIAPQRFQEDLTPVADQLSYQLRADVFTDPNDDIDVRNVELWDSTTTPISPVSWLTPKGPHPSGLAYSQAGWEVWGGKLYLPNTTVSVIDPAVHVLRVWGYSPWEAPVDDADVIAINSSLEEALVLHTQIGLLRRLTNNRALFKQWQTRSNNTDVSMASLLSDLQNARDEWKVLSRAITVAREGQ